MTAGPTAQRATTWLVAIGLTASLLGCHTDAGGDSSDEPTANYQAEVDEGLGAAVAILIDTSGSMADAAPGDSRPKAVVAREALEAMLDATDAFTAKRPDFPIKIGLYSFASRVSKLQPIEVYDRARIRTA